LVNGAGGSLVLFAIEFHGLWLQSEELAARLLHEDNHPYSSDTEHDEPSSSRTAGSPGGARQ
jgi:hypothetical protein